MMSLAIAREALRNAEHEASAEFGAALLMCTVRRGTLIAARDVSAAVREARGVDVATTNVTVRFGVVCAPTTLNAPNCTPQTLFDTLPQLALDAWPPHLCVVVTYAHDACTYVHTHTVSAPNGATYFVDGMVMMQADACTTFVRTARNAWVRVHDGVACELPWLPSTPGCAQVLMLRRVTDVAKVASGQERALSGGSARNARTNVLENVLPVLAAQRFHLPACFLDAPSVQRLAPFMRVEKHAFHSSAASQRFYVHVNADTLIAGVLSQRARDVLRAVPDTRLLVRTLRADDVAHALQRAHEHAIGACAAQATAFVRAHDVPGLDGSVTECVHAHASLRDWVRTAETTPSLVHREQLTSVLLQLCASWSHAAAAMEYVAHDVRPEHVLLEAFPERTMQLNVRDGAASTLCITMRAHDVRARHLTRHAPAPARDWARALLQLVDALCTASRAHGGRVDAWLREDKWASVDAASSLHTVLRAHAPDTLTMYTVAPETRYVPVEHVLAKSRALEAFHDAFTRACAQDA
jgi:hypothetical protein